MSAGLYLQSERQRHQARKGNSMSNQSDLISISEYAALHGKKRNTIQAKCIRGGYKTARKIGHNWVISASEPYNDLRETAAGKYKDWRKTGRQSGRNNDK